MNILLVTMSMQIGGAETHVLELAKGLKRRGYTVYVMSNGGDYVQELSENGIEHIWAPIHNRNFGNMLKSYKILKQIIKDKNIDIVHAHARIPAMIASYACKATKVPLVTTAHGVYKINIILKALTNWGRKTIAVSEDIKEYLIKEYGLKQGDISITVNGIDMEKFRGDVDYSSILQEFKINSNMKKIVHVSRLDKETSIVADIIIDMAKNFDNAQFVIVGNGSEYSNLLSKAKAINNYLGYEKIVMAGGRTDVNKFVALSDVFVGVSRAALEAMSAKKPVILAGNQGYLGIMSENVLETALETNFCCRGLALPTAEKVSDDLKSLSNLSKDEIIKIGEYNNMVVKKYYSIDKMIDDAIKMYESLEA